MERLHDIEVHILDWYEFEELMDGNFRPTKKQISTNASKFAVPNTNAIRAILTDSKVWNHILTLTNMNGTT